MKARCVGTNHGSVAATIGKIYEVVEDDKSNIIPLLIIDDDNERQWMSLKDFELLPDEPAAPKPDWMQTSDAGFVNIQTGIHLIFSSDEHQVNIGSVLLSDYNMYVQSRGKFADAFASLVGYKWSDK